MLHFVFRDRQSPRAELEHELHQVRQVLQQKELSWQGEMQDYENAILLRNDQVEALQKQSQDLQLEATHLRQQLEQAPGFAELRVSDTSFTSSMCSLILVLIQ